MHNLVRILCSSITWVIHIHVAKMVRRIRIWLLCRALLISNVSLNGRMDGGAWGSVYSISFCTKKCKMLPMFAQPHSPAATLFATVIIWPKILESRLETLQWGRNIVLIWGITKPFQQNEVPCYTCKEFRALKANVIFKVAYSLNIEQGTSFSGKVWWYLKSKLCCGPTVTFPI